MIAFENRHPQFDDDYPDVLDLPEDQRHELLNDRGRQMKAKPIQRLCEDHGMPQLFARPRTRMELGLRTGSVDQAEHARQQVTHRLGPAELRDAGAEGRRCGHPLCYSAGVMGLSQEHPRTIRHRSVEPVLPPLLKEERHGTVPNVVFPTGIDRRDDLGLPDRIDAYFGMADSRIGVARLDVPEHLPPVAPTDYDGPKAGGPQ